MNVTWNEGSLDLDRHLTSCGHLRHHLFRIGVYDRWGQRVNQAASLVCDSNDSVSNAEAAAAGWRGGHPGLTVAVWVDITVRPPWKLADGPSPDAVLGADGVVRQEVAQ